MMYNVVEIQKHRGIPLETYISLRNHPGVLDGKGALRTVHEAGRATFHTKRPT